MSSFSIILILQSFPVQKNVPTVWPHTQWSSLGSRPPPFDVAALFVHQRQRSARSHSTICHLLNPPLWLGSGRIVCFLHQEVRNMRSHSHLSTRRLGHRVRSAEIRCDFSPAFQSGVGSDVTNDKTPLYILSLCLSCYIIIISIQQLDLKQASTHFSGLICNLSLSVSMICDISTSQSWSICNLKPPGHINGEWTFQWSEKHRVSSR